jgi:hypothetical protein
LYVRANNPGTTTVARSARNAAADDHHRFRANTTGA